MYIIRVTLGPLYRFVPLRSPALPGLPMANYANGWERERVSGYITVPVSPVSYDCEAELMNKSDHIQGWPKTRPQTHDHNSVSS